MVENIYASKSLLLLGFKKELSTAIISILDAIKVGQVPAQPQGTSAAGEASLQRAKENAVKLFDPIYKLDLEEINKVPIETANNAADCENNTSDKGTVVYGPDEEQVELWFNELLEKNDGSLPDVIIFAWSTDCDENANFGYQLVYNLVLNSFENNPIMPVLLDKNQQRLINCDLNSNLAGFFRHGMICLPHEKGESTKISGELLGAIIAKRFLPKQWIMASAQSSTAE